MASTSRSEEAMAKAYDPAAHEERLYEWWEERGYFKPETQAELGQVDPDAEPFVIAMPPPNVTGALHMGHALTASVEDLLIRFNRLKGRPSLWIPGTDHAGIATQNVVERALADEGLSRHDLGRERFEERVWEWKKQYGDRITVQHRRLGVSADWTRERFTLDEGLSAAVKTAFLRLFERGLIYRDVYLVNWCPRCQTVISDIEVEHSDTTGKLYQFRYPLESGGSIPVSTTRPETILGDTAVAVHPEDERYAELVGQTAVVPAIGRRIPVIADEYVDREFGTGALKITPAHDPNDYEIAERHGLDRVNIMRPDGTLNENAGPYAGLDRFEARSRLWSDMESEGLVVDVKEHLHSIGHCQRCDTVVEPLLSTQWFVRAKPLAEPAMAAVRDGRVRIVPERFTREYFHWMENIRDWVISRQLWWGHRIPVWYGPDGQPIAARSEAEARSLAEDKFGEEVALEREEDVLDTWFSSALWPFSTLGWPEETSDLEKYYPTDVLETGYDILFFWVARMIMMGLAQTGEVPFHTVYLHGLVRDAQGRKMSKSLGNAMDPLELIEEYGTDALRFTMLTGSTPGQDMKLSQERIEGSRNFANKLWNIGRFIATNLPEDFEPLGQQQLESQWQALGPEDRWILSRLSAVVDDVTRNIDAFQLGEAGRSLHDFTWSELADWYVEAAKPRLYGEDPRAADAVRQVLYTTFGTALVLLHPFMPFVTEAIWSHLPRAADDWPALMVSRWPTSGRRDEAAENLFDTIREIVRGIRNVRAEYGVDPARRVAATIAAGGRAAAITSNQLSLVTLARLDPEALLIAETPAAPDEAHATVIGGEGIEVWLPLAGMIDLAKELERLEAEASDVETEMARLDKVLANEAFVERAPADVVQRERDKLVDARARAEALEKRMAQLRVVD